jgi:hypothetical protein
MNKADKYYIQNIQKIMSEGSWDENPRPKYPDGDPAYSKFITGVFEEYDISKGEFPIRVGSCILQEPVDILFELLSGVRLPRGYLIEGAEHGFIHRSGIVQKYSNDLLNSFCSMLVNDG